MQVLMANEPRASREAICEALRILRPHVDVTLEEPKNLGNLNREKGLGSFDLVLHTGLGLRNSGVPDQNRLTALIDICPGDKPPCHVEIDGKSYTVPELELGDILWIVDRFAHTANAVDKR